MIEIGNIIVMLKNYNRDKELPLGDKLILEAAVEKYSDLIKNFKPGTGEETIDLGNGIEGIAKVGRKPETDRFMQKTSNLKALGRYNEAIKTLHSLSRWYAPDAQIRSELWTIYEEVNEYEIALQYYQKIMDTSPDYRQQTMEKIITLYIAMGDWENAGKIYVQYITKEKGMKNFDIENQIKELNK